MARHPVRDEFLVGGADGVPQAYRIVRKVQRHIGDNALCIRKWPAMDGRIYAVDFAPDGKSFAAVSSLDGQGAVSFFNYDFDTEMPADMLAIESKDEGGRNDAEKAKLAAHYASEVKMLGSVPFGAGQFALRWLRDGSAVAVAGEDGKVRFISATEPRVVKEFTPVPPGPVPATTVR